MEGVRGSFGDEMANVLYEMRRSPRFGLPWDADSVFNARIDHSVGREHPLVVDLKSIRKLCTAEKIEVPKLIEPFLTIVKSEVVNSSITAVALSAVERLLQECSSAQGEEDLLNFSEAVDDTMEACSTCAYESVDSAKDDLVLIRRIRVAAAAVKAGLPRCISDATILTGFELCLRSMFSRRGTDALRREGEDSILCILRSICSLRLDDDNDVLKLAAREPMSKLLKELRASNLGVGDFEFENCGFEASITRPPTFASQHALLLFSSLLADCSITRSVRERLLGLRLLKCALQSLPSTPHSELRQVVIGEASIAVLRNLGSVPPPPPLIFCSAMTAGRAVYRCLGSSSAAFLFLLLRTVFSDFIQRKNVHAVLREIGMEAIGSFVTSPGLVTSVYAAIDCEPSFPDVAEGFLDILGSIVQNAFPLEVRTLSEPMVVSSISEMVKTTELKDLRHVEIQPLDVDPNDDIHGEEQLAARAVGLIGAKILLDLVDSMAMRSKISEGETNAVPNGADDATGEKTAKRREQKSQKNKLRLVVEGFNQTMQSGSGPKALNLLKNYSCIKNLHQGKAKDDAEMVARFMRCTPDLDKANVGVVLGEPDEFSTQVLARYTDTFVFAGVGFIDAIRIYLESFRLPGESQKIERIMYSFAERYYKENTALGGPLESADVTFILSYAVVMLNTDRHNDSVKKKMTLEGFIRNNRGINNGKDVPKEFLEEIYDSIAEEEIKMSDEAGVDALTNAHWRAHLHQFGLLTELGTSVDVVQTILPQDAALHDEEIFRMICNRSVHSAFALLEEAEDTSEAQSALEGFTAIARCASAYRMTSVVDLIVNLLGSASRLLGGPLKDTVTEFGTRIKAQMSTVSLFAVARQAGDWMRLGGWQSLVACVLRLHILDLLPADLETDLSSYGTDLVDSSGNVPIASPNIPSWWPCQRHNTKETKTDGLAKKSRPSNGLWSIFGSGANSASANGMKEEEDMTPPDFLQMRTPDELNARELARKCIQALRVEEVFIGETRFLRSDSLMCLCAAIANSAPSVNRPPAKNNAQADGKDRNEKSNPASRSGDTEIYELRELDRRTRACVTAFCIDLLCEIALKNRDRLVVTWPPLCGMLMRTLQAASPGSALMERAVVTILRISLRFLHREEVRNEAVSLLEMLEQLDEVSVQKFSHFLPIGLYQLIKFQAQHLTLPRTRSAVIKLVEKISRSGAERAELGLEILQLITQDNLNWCAGPSNQFGNLTHAVAAYGSLSTHFAERAVELLKRLCSRITTLAEAMEVDGVVKPNQLYSAYWLPLAQAYATLVKTGRGEEQESTMLVLEQMLSSEACEKALDAKSWKDLFCTLLIPLIQSDLQGDEETDAAGSAGRTRLRGVMTLSKIFLLQHAEIWESVAADEFVEMWKGVLRSMELVAAANVKDAKDYIPECVKNMVLVMAASRILQRGVDPVWSTTESSVKHWMPDVLDYVESIGEKSGV